MIAAIRRPASAVPATRRIFPRLGIRLRADVEEFSKLALLRYAAARTAGGALVLDAGAGSCTARAYFPHARYESCDIIQNDDSSLTFLCDLRSVPRSDASYDAIVCAQVLDDVPDPQAVVSELCRILRPGGSLFLTAPLSGRVHNAPYHYFHFSRGGLELLFCNAGFEIEFIRPRGGVFWCLSHMSRKLPNYLWRQQVERYAAARAAGHGLLRGIAMAAAYPFYRLAQPAFQLLFPWMLFYLDRFDTNQSFTMGYACHCRRPTIDALPLAERSNPKPSRPVNPIATAT